MATTDAITAIAACRRCYAGSGVMAHCRCDERPRALTGMTAVFGPESEGVRPARQRAEPVRDALSADGK
jgi:hypothetical protein